jgi:hypothetical protein
LRAIFRTNLFPRKRLEFCTLALLDVPGNVLTNRPTFLLRMTTFPGLGKSIGRLSVPKNARTGWGPAVVSLTQGQSYPTQYQNLAVFALLAMALGVSLNWRNDKAGYCINLVVVAVVDLGFVLLIVIPGYLQVSVGALAGPIVYIVAAIFSTIGRLSPGAARFRR